MNEGELIEQVRAIIKDSVTPIKEKVDQIHRILVGNGQPNEGLIAQTAMNTEFRKSYKRLWIALMATAAGAVLSGIGMLIAGRF